MILDPVGKAFGYDIGRVRADIVTISHHHPGHDRVEAMTGECKVIDGPGEYEIKDVFITGVRTYHDDERGARDGHNTVYVIHIDDLVFCHLGDLGHPLSSDQVDQIGAIDVLMVPAGGRSLSVARAAEVISQLEPGLVVPMHYATASTTATALEPLDKFSREMGLQEVVARDKLVVRKADIPETTQVVVLSDRATA